MRLLFAWLSVMLVTSPSSFCTWVNRKRLGFHVSLRSLILIWKINKRKRLWVGRNTWLNMQELPDGLYIGTKKQRPFSMCGERFIRLVQWCEAGGWNAL